jgi:predicted adenylyl cyclase CyaB
MSTKNNTEREIKFHSEDLAKLRERLGELEAERVGPAAFEDNWILDRGDELQSGGKILRLRSDGTRSHLTFKGPLRMEGKMKIRVEHEIGIESAEAARQLFEQLGYHVVRRYQKVREEWQLGGVTIALDHTPIGDFAEFEGEGAQTVARRCGFKPDDGEARSYLRLYEDYLREHPDAPPEMTFPK